MPLGSQEGDTGPQAVALLETEGRDVTITLRDLALEMQQLIADVDSASARDVTAMLATRLLGRLDAEWQQPG